ncbi:Uncharacterised protein [Salmonella enterica subsp. arizonae]|uniref:Uncharacterized protein n=1 Tax=Salmonella enterica subsp. arizonae TaxID=59203 RepID=A0A447RB00_SALER|nr:Uncharacterised protein [Salmonella enterica subsp. arizonae]
MKIALFQKSQDVQGLDSVGYIEFYYQYIFLQEVYILHGLALPLTCGLECFCLGLFLGGFLFSMFLLLRVKHYVVGPAFLLPQLLGRYSDVT